jgi:tRNA dimethylallyltransferase
MTGPVRPAPELLVMVGPTGTGKSAFALDLAEALNGEIIGCDALQIYRGLDAATAKPSLEDRRRVRHHLIDCIDPCHDFTLADYVKRAEGAILQIQERGSIPLVVGGTGMYLRGLLRGVLAAPPRDDELRRRLRGIAGRGGSRHLRKWLERFDPDSARRIPPADLQRTIRAIELARTPGANWSERLKGEGTWDGARERYSSLKIGLDLDREALHRTLDARVDAFFSSGLVDEVRRLLREGVPASANAFKAIGYREVLRSLERGDDPDRVREAVKRSTRRYSKKQRTWFRGENDVEWLDSREDGTQLVEHIVRLWRRKTAGRD